jgi:hypothetical protein
LKYIGNTIEAVDKQFTLNGPGAKLAMAFEAGTVTQ